MEKITYILGAGASADSLPQAKDLPIKMLQFFEPFFTKEASLIVSRFWVDLNHLIKHCGKGSIDLYARKLHLAGRKDILKSLKIILSEYFTLFQMLNDHDSRYDYLLSSLIKGAGGQDIIIPPNINIINWNYDLQFELAAAKILQLSQISMLERYFNMLPRPEYKEKVDKMTFIKLNGSAAFAKNKNLCWIIDSQYPGLSVEEETNTEFFLRLCKRYEHNLSNHDYTPSIRFAWEDMIFASELIEAAKYHIRQSSIIVIIGYSFPTFNRIVDRSILSEIREATLKYIYIQNPSWEDVKTRITSLVPDLNINKIRHSATKDEFYIPYEFD
jgi:hypothetical protein